MADGGNVVTGLLRAVPYGAGALAVLRDVLGELRGGDPLAPAEVAVPSSFTAVTVRRRLAAPGLVGVRFSALPRLIADRAAGELAAAGRRPLTLAQRRAAVRAVLAAGTGELPEAARRSAGTAGVVAGIFAELDDAEAGDADLRILAGAGGWAAELSALYRAYLEATAGAARPREIVDAACRAGGGAPLVIYLPRWLTAGELRFCRALAGRCLLRVVLGFTGDSEADAGAVAILDALAPGVPLPAGAAVPAGGAAGAARCGGGSAVRRPPHPGSPASEQPAAGGPGGHRLPGCGSLCPPGRRTAIRRGTSAPRATSADARAERGRADAPGPARAARRGLVTDRGPGPAA